VASGLLIYKAAGREQFLETRSSETDKLAASRDWAKDTEQGLQGSEISGKEPTKTASRKGKMSGYRAAIL
jgi:hypothetical protein